MASQWWHGRSAWRLAGDTAVAQGAEAVVERDGDCGVCFARLSKGRDKGNGVRRARRRQVAAVGRQRRREVAGGGRAMAMWSCVRT
jgi:hypothetical protein